MTTDAGRLTYLRRELTIHPDMIENTSDELKEKLSDLIWDVFVRVFDADVEILTDDMQEIIKEAILAEFVSPPKPPIM